jgi:hypothetical protein
MATGHLVPSVDRRLSAWLSVQDRLQRPARQERRPTITLSRQFGCEAYPLAESLADALAARTGRPWTVFDKALIERVSRETRLSEQLLARLGDESRALDKLAGAIPGWRTHAEAYEALARHIVRIAREGDAIIVGRGGAIVAQDLPDCYHFRLEAPREYRIASIQQRLGVGPEEAAALVDEHQRGREGFIEEFLHCSVGDTRWYHAVFNMSRNPLARTTASILALLPFAD